MEIILVDISSTECPDLPGSGHRRVQVIPFERPNFYGEAMAEGVRYSQAPIVAFLEEHALACPRWADALLRSFEGPWSAVGCMVKPAIKRSSISRAVALLNDERWSSAEQAGEVPFIRGHNASYRRQVLIDLGQDLAENLEFELFFHQTLHEQGHRLLLNPDVRIVHMNEASWMSLISMYATWNRTFGAARCRHYEWGWWDRFARTAGLPLVPFLRLGRTLWERLRRKDVAFPMLLSITPAMFAAHAASAWGQCLGLLFGPGDSPARFLDHEVDAERQLPDRDWTAC
jgi:hypothetical protein